MAELDFLNTNDNIDYPFIQGSITSFSSPPVQIPKLGIVDINFLMGVESQFLAGTHEMHLVSVTKTASYVAFRFESTVPVLAGTYWNFVVDLDTEFGCSVYISSSGSYLGDSAGVGSLVVGDLSEWRSYDNGTYICASPLPVEPALIQSAYNSFIKQIVVCNTGRPCPTHCCETSSVIDNTVYIQSYGLINNVRLKEGYNCQILVSAKSNTVEIKAVKGGGDGPTCSDIRVTSEGVIFDNGSLCESCQDYISSINGVETSDGAFRITGELGLVVTSDAGSNKLFVLLDEHQIAHCDGSSLNA